MPAAERQFTRYNVSHSELVGGSISEAGTSLRMISLSKGGCGFVSTDLVEDFAPPKEVVCSIYEKDGLEYRSSELLLGNLVYIRPTNGSIFTYGVRFHENERKKIEAFVKRLEALSQSGKLEKTWTPASKS